MSQKYGYPRNCSNELKADPLFLPYRKIVRALIK
jgi:hypothetical protein